MDTTFSPSALWLVMSLASHSDNGGLGVTRTGSMNIANVSGRVERSGKKAVSLFKATEVSGAVCHCGIT